MNANADESTLRGSFGFETDGDGRLASTDGNAEKLRQLWLDRALINGDDLGPGDEGDFDYGAWHISCHLVAAGGVMRAADGSMLWLEVSYDTGRDRYYASITQAGDSVPRTMPLVSKEGQSLVAGAVLLGFVEGNSSGRLSASGISDPDNRFCGNPRQEYDRAPDDPREGGKVWEHWCTLRDLRETSPIGASVLSAYVSLVNVLGDRFVSVVARGRHEYAHPRQLCTMVVAGLVSLETALVTLQPSPIPPEAAEDFSMANPGITRERCDRLDWRNPLRYYMFERRINSWVKVERLAAEFERFTA